jgi:hypothetical protein
LFTEHAIDGPVPSAPSTPLLGGCLAGDEDEAVRYVSQLVSSPELRSRVGAAARQEVSLWDWRAATQYLLRVQYPLAMAAAAAYYARRAGRADADVVGSGGAAAAAVPAPAA